MKFYEFYIDESKENNEVFAISLVEKPAIQTDFVKFNEEKKTTFAIQDEEKRIVSGPALIPNKLIYRNGGEVNFEESYVSLSEDTVIKCAHLYLKRNHNNNVTLDHSEDTDKVTLMESWIIEDLSNDKANSLGYSDLPLGTWMVTFKVEDDEVWESVKSGEYNGFSIEGFFSKREVNKTNMSNEEEDKDIYDEILDILEDDNIEYDGNKEIYQEILDILEDKDGEK